jgi:hypothetical protein
MILPNYVTDCPCSLSVTAIPKISGSEHGVQDSAMNGLQPISQLRQSSAHDDTHGVIQIRFLDLLFYAYRSPVVKHSQMRYPFVLGPSDQQSPSSAEFYQSGVYSVSTEQTFLLALFRNHFQGWGFLHRNRSVVAGEDLVSEMSLRAQRSNLIEKA